MREGEGKRREAGRGSRREEEGEREGEREGKTENSSGPRFYAAAAHEILGYLVVIAK